MNSTEEQQPPHHFVRSSTNYVIIIPISMCCAFISIFISCVILILISSTNRLHTITHLLISNTCLSSIVYSCVQSINYFYLIFISWDTNDITCRFRAYVGYMSIASMMYSYLIQAVSRYFFSIVDQQSRWMLSFQSHCLLILIQWIIVLCIPLPALITQDVSYRPTFLCWVPKEKFQHMFYTLLTCYLIPNLLIIGIYIKIYCRVKSYEKPVLEPMRRMKQARNLKILRNILILIGIYTCGGIPMAIYIITRMEIFYSLGIVFVSLFVAIEKLVTILLDREIRNTIKRLYWPPKIIIVPVVLHQDQRPIQPKVNL